MGEYQLASAPESLVIDYFVYFSGGGCGGSALQYVETADSVIGHAAVSEVLSVAALNASTPTQVASYSSRGPGSISFPSSQTRMR